MWNLQGNIALIYLVRTRKISISKIQVFLGTREHVFGFALFHACNNSSEFAQTGKNWTEL